MDTKRPHCVRNRRRHVGADNALQFVDQKNMQATKCVLVNRLEEKVEIVGRNLGVMKTDGSVG
jgi:hypothetical protein